MMKGSLGKYERQVISTLIPYRRSLMNDWVGKIWSRVDSESDKCIA